MIISNIFLKIKSLFCKKQKTRLKIYSNSDKCWFNSKGDYHNESGPALICSSGVFWYINGKSHRIDGPADMWTSGSMFWYINGKQYNDNQSYQKAAGISDEDMAMIVLKYGNVK